MLAIVLTARILGWQLGLARAIGAVVFAIITGLLMAWRQVRKNAGAAGIDKMTVEAFEQREDELITLIQEKLKAGVYRFRPARRVLIPKEGRSKKRKLGIPVVMDRVVSQSMNLVLEGIFAPGFTESNFGFRRGKSQHQAIRHVQEIVRDG